MNPGAIYGLHTGDNVIRYVGRTKGLLGRRLRSHKSAARLGSTQLVHVWMREVGLDDIKIALIEECAVEDLVRRESYWMVEKGTLVDAGGFNVDPGPRVKPEKKARTPYRGGTWAGANEIRWADPAQRGAASARMKARWVSDEVRELQRQSTRAWWTPERRAWAAENARLGLHKRHHANRGIVKPECGFCQAA